MISIIKSLFDKLHLSNFLNRINSPTTKATTKVKAHTIKNLKITNQVLPAGYSKKSLSGLPQATSSELQQKVIRRKVVYLHDIAELNDAPQIQDRVFDKCEIRGPSIIIPNKSEFNDCEFDGDKGTLFIPVNGDRLIIGAIGVSNCRFNGCIFVGIGMLMSSAQIPQLP